LFDWKSIGQELQSRLSGYSEQTVTRSAGIALSSGDGVVHLNGLAGCRMSELIEFENGVYGIVMNLDPDTVGAVLLGEESNVSVGMRAYGTGQVLEIPTGEGLLGRIVDPLGRPLDEGGPVRASRHRPIEYPAPPIIDRHPVNRPMETGLMIIDAIVPIGRGQRELILGDRQTGKTSVAIDTILNQRGKNVFCFYVAIGQKASSLAHIIDVLRENEAMEYTTVVCATASDSSTMQYIAPYSGCSMAEYFMYGGKDTLIIYDDLSKHAAAYRAMSLLLRRPPGREAYPGDVFYLHSRLLERAAHLSKLLGGGSMTALPIIETQEGDISAYIPTNVISITDGQIYLESDLFRAGVRPAVNGGLSVSRVGGAAQIDAMRKVSGQMRLELAQYRELQVFSQFSSDLDEATQKILNYGSMLTEALKQRNNSPLKMSHQVALLYAITRRLLPFGTVIRKFADEFPKLLDSRYPHIEFSISASGKLSDETAAEIRKAVSEWLAAGGDGGK
jgi:F-type H+-transporting ATPase subunit alpha